MKTCSACGCQKPDSQFVRSQCKPCRNQKIMEWRKANPEKCKLAKQKYYASEKGKLQKQKEEAAYLSTGKRAANERRRAARPISEARRQAKARYQVLRRSGDKALDAFSKWVLLEAIKLAKKRESVCGGQWHVDHIVPVSKGGKSTFDNIQVVPAFWNRSKSNRHNGRFFACTKESP